MVMRGVHIAKTGSSSVLKFQTDLPKPVPAANEVLVRNTYSGVNYIDIYFRTGLYPAPSFPHVLGREAAGVVEVASNGFEAGERVVYIGVGTYAQFSAVPSSDLLRIPAGVDDATAAASLLQGLTAITLIYESGKVQRGQWTLVHAAAGGVGTLLVQILHVLGAKVIGTAGSAEKCKLAKSLGADYTVNYSTEDLVSRVQEITGGHGVDVIFDGVGKATFDQDLEIVARKGTLIVFGNASGSVPPIETALLTAKNVTLVRPTVLQYVAEREELELYAEKLFALITAGHLKILVHDTYDLKDVVRAHEDLEGRKTTGKVLLKI